MVVTGDGSGGSMPPTQTDRQTDRQDGPLSIGASVSVCPYVSVILTDKAHECIPIKQLWRHQIPRVGLIAGTQ